MNIRRRALAILAMAGLAGVAGGASANDTSAALGTGGLQFVQNDSVEMRSEDLFVSEREIRVRYVFRNGIDRDVTSIVAFPMPDIAFTEREIDIPNRTTDNFLDFETSVNGQPVETAVERRVFALGLERTRLLEQLNVPLMPFLPETASALDALTDDRKAELVLLGIARVDEYDVGKGMQKHLSPFNWTLKTTYFWTQAFPAGQDMVIEHRYRPSVGKSLGTRYDPAAKSPEAAEELRRMTETYCIDAGFKAAVMRAPKSKESSSAAFTEARISYVLKTGSNWLGPISDFTLTIDKGAPENLISFCGSDVRKTGPTTFQIKATDFYPRQDLDVLILKPL